MSNSIFYFSNDDKRLKINILGLKISYNKKQYDPKWFKQHGLHRENKIFTHMKPEEKIKLYETVKEYSKEDMVVVEIGSYLGTSSCFLAAALDNGKLYCIDPWDTYAPKDCPKGSYVKFCENTKKYEDKIVKIKGLSQDVVDQVKAINKTIDVLFIDGNHKYDGVKSDWDLYSPMLKKGSVVIFHDTGCAQGVVRLIEESVENTSENLFKLPNMWGYILK